METKEYRTIDKSKWGPGAWQDEPDKRQWTDPKTGLACLIVRNGSGTWCGYVGVPEGHSFHGVEYGDIENYPRVHGGLTYSDHCSEGPEESAICHLPAPGEPDSVWWLGFDCAHAGDYMPAMGWQRRDNVYRDAYRDVDYVTMEVTKLAEQLSVS